MILASINWFTPLYLLAIYGTVVFFIKRTNAKPGQVNWSPWEAVGVTLAIFFAAQLIGGLLAYLYPAARGWNHAQTLDWLENSIAGQFVTIALVEAITVWLLHAFLKGRKATFRTIGLKRRPIWSDVGYVLIGFVVYFGLYLVLLAVVRGIFPSLNVDQQQQIGFSNPSHWQLPMVFLSLVVFPPVVEELLVRGFLYTGLKHGMKLAWAVLITSGLFAVAHLQAGSGEPLLWVAAIDTFTLSLVLIYLREKTGSLWASIGLHMLKNLVAFLGLFIFHIV